MNRERVARSGLISLAGGGTGAVFGLILAVVVGRGLGPEDTGFFFQMVALFMIIANVGELGADTGLVRELARQVSLGRYADLVRTIVIATIPVAVIGAVVLTAIWLLAPEVAQVISSPAAHTTTTHLIVNTIPFALLASLMTVLLGATRGLGGILPFVGIINIGLPVARVVVVLIVLSAGFGLIATAQAWAWPLVAACAGAAVILARQLSRMAAHPDAGTDADAAAAAAAAAQPRTSTRALAREFWSFSAARGVAAALEIGLAWADVLLVAALLGPTEAGVYAIVSRAARAGLLVDTAMRMALSPRVSASLAVGDLDGARALHLSATRSLILLSWPVYLTLALFAPAVLAAFGQGFDAGGNAMIALCAAMMLLSATGMLQTVLLMGGRSRWQMGNKAAALAVNIIGILLLVPLWGIVGAAVAWVVTVAVDAALAFWQVHRLMDVGIAVRGLLPAVGVVVGAVVLPGLLIRGVLGATLPALAVHLALAAAVFVLLCLRFREQFELDALSRILRSRMAKGSRR